jgi:ATP-dependent RNA helicase SUPV3L1/SUV3
LQIGGQAPSLPAPASVSVTIPADWPTGFAAGIGWVETGPILLRLDVAERVAADLFHRVRRRPAALPADLVSRLSIRADQLPAVLRGLGLRLIPATSLAENVYGPPAPPLITARRVALPPPVCEARPTPPTPSHGPFAALAALQR